MFSLHGYGPSILEGTFLTIAVALSSLLISMILGIIGALAKLSTSKILQIGAKTYTTIIRGIPDLVLMLLVFFGGQVFINELAPLVGYDEYIDINPFIAGVCTIGFIFGNIRALPELQIWQLLPYKRKRLCNFGSYRK